MEKKYVVKDFADQLYYQGESYGWGKEPFLSDYFDTIEDAERFIQRQDGKFQIETVYVV
jgi:hypothetical protein